MHHILLKDTHMNWDQIETNWQQLKGNIQQQWNRLTDDDLDAMDGKRDGLSGKIQETYGINKVEADHQLDNWQSTQNDPVNLYNTDVKGDLNNDMNSLSDVNNVKDAKSDIDIRSASNTTHTNNFGYDDAVDNTVDYTVDDMVEEQKSHNTAGNAPRIEQGGMGDNESIAQASSLSDKDKSNASVSSLILAGLNSDNPVSVSQNSGSSGSVIQGSKNATGSTSYNDIDGDIGHQSLGYNATDRDSSSMQDSMSNNESIEPALDDTGLEITASDRMQSSTNEHEISNSSTPNASSRDTAVTNQYNPGSTPNPDTQGPGDGAGLPGNDEPDEDMDDFDSPAPNPMPDDFNEPVRVEKESPNPRDEFKHNDDSKQNNEAPHDEKGLDQT